MTRVVMAAVVAMAGAAGARADERLFTYVYEPDVLLEGKWELEQWATYRADREEGTFRVLDLRTEIEYGLTERLTTALYLNTVHEHVVTDEESEKGFDWQSVSSEWKVRILSPFSDPVGVLLYGEATWGKDERELEEKVVIGHHGERFTWSANLVVEQEWEDEGDETEKESVLETTGGVAWRFGPHWSAGLELRNHRLFEDGLGFSGESYSAWFLGPNVHYAGGRWWTTLTVLPQLKLERELELDEHERLEVRAVAGVLF